MRFRDGVIGTARFAFTAHEQVDLVEIAGSRGVLRYSTFGEVPFEITTAGGTTRTEIAHPAHVQQPLIQSIVDELRGLGSCPSTGNERRAHRLGDGPGAGGIPERLTLTARPHILSR